jgi:crotonobetaine/carnitine-CoA ligase
MKRVLGRDIVADNLADLFDWRLAKDPDRRFARFADESVTYAELDDMASRVQTALSRDGVATGDVLATFMHNSLWHLATLFACARAGVVWAPINASLGEEDLAYTVQDLGAERILVDSDLLGSFSAAGGESLGARAVVFGECDSARLPRLADWLPERGSNTRAEVRAGDPFCVMYSGGTTGRPKGVVLPHFAAVSCAMRIGEVADFREQEVWFSSSHLYHALLPCGVLPFCLLHGYEVCFARWWSAGGFIDQVRSFGATIVDPFIGMVATLLRTPERSDDPDNPARLSISGYGGADPASAELRLRYEKRFGVRTLQPYGQTEAGGFVTTEFADEPVKTGSSGKRRGWFELEIVDDEGLPLPTGQIGEIRVRPRAPHMMAHGYLNRPEETLRNWRDLWVHTGDHGYLDAEGDLFFVGRQGHFLRRRGELVSVAEVEEVVGRFPGVQEVAIVAVPSDLAEDDIKCCLVPEEGVKLDPREIVEFCAGKLARFKLPRFVEEWDALPRTATKAEIDRAVLQRSGVENAWDGGAGGRRPELNPSGGSDG